MAEWRIETVRVGRKDIPSIMYYLPSEGEVTSRIAAFDLVNTLIWSDCGDYTVRGVDKWVWRSTEIPSFLGQLQKRGWTIVIFSNYISKNLDELRSRFAMMLADSSFLPNIFFFASLRKDKNQKPEKGMWDLFTSIWEQRAGKKLIPTDDSFYVGDRSGNPNAVDPMFRKGGVKVSSAELTSLGLSGDTSMGDDSLFAARTGLTFALPSELPPQPLPLFPPFGQQEIIIMVGQQGSGKTRWATDIATNFDYAIVASEATQHPTTYVVKDKKKRLRIIQELLDEGRSIVVDATHPTRASRQAIIELGAPTRIFWLSRPGRLYNQERANPVHEVALRTYTKQFERPSDDEGVPVVRIDWNV